MYMFGMSSSVSTSELKTPPMTTMPRLEREAEPGSSASASGMLPATTEKLVMMIGRNRVWALSLIAASLSKPALAQRVGVVDEQNAVLRRDADEQIVPISEKRLSVWCVRTSAPIAPIAATGTEKMMMNGER